MLTQSRFGRLASHGGVGQTIAAPAARDLMAQALGRIGPVGKVLLIPPDFTRYHSGAGELTVTACDLLGPGVSVDILPALGTHSPMSASQIATMFPGLAPEQFLVHHWLRSILPIGTVPGEFVREVFKGRVAYDM